MSIIINQLVAKIFLFDVKVMSVVRLVPNVVVSPFDQRLFFICN